MSQAEIELMRRAYATFAAEGPEGALAFFDEAIEIEESPEFPDTGTFKGHAGLLEIVSRYTETFDDFHMEPEEFIEGTDGRVIVVLSVGGTGKASRMPTEIRSYHVHTIRGGKSIRLRVLLDREGAFEAAGLPGPTAP